MDKKNELMEKIGQVMKDARNQFKDTPVSKLQENPEKLRSFIRNKFKVLLDDHLETLSRLAVVETRDPVQVAELFTAMIAEDVLGSLSRMQNSSTLDEEVSLAKEKYHKAIDQIPAIKQAYFPDDKNILVFHLNFPPPINQRYSLYHGNDKKKVGGTEIMRAHINGQPFFGAFRIRKIYNRLVLNLVFNVVNRDPSADSEFETYMQKRQLTNLKDFNFLRPPFLRSCEQKFPRISPELMQPFNLPEIPDQFFHTTDIDLPESEVTDYLGTRNKIELLGINGLFGLPVPVVPTYVSRDESMSLSHYLQHGTSPDRLYEVVINPEELIKKRNIFVDPDCVQNPAEIGLNFLFGGGIPNSAIKEIKELEPTDIIIQGEK